VLILPNVYSCLIHVNVLLSRSHSFWSRSHKTCSVSVSISSSVSQSLVSVSVSVSLCYGLVNKPAPNLYKDASYITYIRNICASARHIAGNTEQWRKTNLDDRAADTDMTGPHGLEAGMTHNNEPVDSLTDVWHFATAAADR